MKKFISNEEFNIIIKPILENKNFIDTQYSIHHGVIKLDHSIKVAYNTYKYSKILNMDYISATRGAILHDFFLSNTNGKSISKEAIELTFNHSKLALDNSNKYFKLNNLERDIIYKHMFPVVFSTIPKYKESLLVATIDKIVGSNESYNKFKKHFGYKILATVIPVFIISLAALFGYN